MAYTSSTIYWRNSAGYGGLLLAISYTFLHKEKVSAASRTTGATSSELELSASRRQSVRETAVLWQVVGSPPSVECIT
ncbi:MAG: hypothetical protein ACK54L_08335, partial [Betaproteobacteria bacterium]